MIVFAQVLQFFQEFDLSFELVLLPMPLLSLQVLVLAFLIL